MNPRVRRIRRPWRPTKACSSATRCRGTGAGPLVLGAGARLRSGTVLYDGTTIGRRLQTGHGVVIREGCEIGDDVSVWSNSVIDYGCRIGDRVKIHCNCYVAQYTELEDDVFLAPGVTIANDLYPGDERSAQLMAGPRIGAGAQIGVNVTILPYRPHWRWRTHRGRIRGHPRHTRRGCRLRQSRCRPPRGRGVARSWMSEWSRTADRPAGTGWPTARSEGNLAVTDLAERKATTAPRLVHEAAKRTVDIVLSLALIIVLAPLLLLLCVLGAVDVRGPALFRQETTGP